MNAPSIPSTPAWPTGDVSLQYKVQLGLWTNWSQGSILGRTLTLGREEGNFLIAFTGVFIAFVGSRCWQIISLALHRHHSTSETREAFHHQRQIILRNATSADSTIAQLIQLHLAWRRERRIFWLLPTILTAFFFVVAFVIAGGFSSQIASSVNTEVLIDGSNCRQINFQNISSNSDAVLEVAYTGDAASNAQNYVEQCYSANSSGLINCKSFAKEKLSSFIDDAAPCPFKNGVCQSNSTNLILDTGYLNSHEDYGINAPPDQRILFRRVMQCAPLVTEGRSTEIQNNTVGNRTAYDYGTSVGSGGVEEMNHTYVVESLDLQYVVDLRAANDVPRFSREPIILTLITDVENGTTIPLYSDFIPDADLARSDAGLYLLFLSGNGMPFAYPTEDPWYRATTPFEGYHTNNLNGNATNYRFDVSASPLACAEQFQFCRSNTTACGPLASASDAITGAFQLFGINSTLNDVMGWNFDSSGNPDASRFQWFASIFYSYPGFLTDVTNNLGAHSLLATQTEGGMQTAALPNNQWQLDLTYIWATTMAMHQAFFTDVAHGSSVALSMVLPSTDAQREMCGSQKIQTTEYTSFSFFALIFVYVIGFVVIIVSYFLDPLLGCLQKRSGYKRYADLEWRANAALHLHRLAHEDADIQDSTWQNCNDIVPTTKSGVLLARLDIEDKTHPRLQKIFTSSQSATQVATSEHPEVRSISTSSNLPETHGHKEKVVTEVSPASNSSEKQDSDETFFMQRRSTL